MRAGCCFAHCPATLRVALAAFGACCAVSSACSARSFMFAPQQPARTVAVDRFTELREATTSVVFGRSTRSAERPCHSLGLSAAVCRRTRHGVQGCTLSVPLTARGGDAASAASCRRSNAFFASTHWAGASLVAPPGQAMRGTREYVPVALRCVLQRKASHNLTGSHNRSVGVDTRHANIPPKQAMESPL